MKGLDWDYQRWPFCWTLLHISTLTTFRYLKLCSQIRTYRLHRSFSAHWIVLFCCRLQHIWLHVKLKRASLRVFYFWRTSSLTPPTWLTVTPPPPPGEVDLCVRAAPGWRPAGSPSDMQAVDCTNWRSANCSRHSTQRHNKNDSIPHSSIKTKN